MSKDCRTCGRRFGSITAFDQHLGSDAELARGEGHSDPKIGFLDDQGIWRLPSADPSVFDRFRVNDEDESAEGILDD